MGLNRAGQVSIGVVFSIFWVCDRRDVMEWYGMLNQLYELGKFDDSRNWCRLVAGTFLIYPL